MDLFSFGLAIWTTTSSKDRNHTHIFCFKNVCYKHLKTCDRKKSSFEYKFSSLITIHQLLSLKASELLQRLRKRFHFARKLPNIPESAEGVKERWCWSQGIMQTIYKLYFYLPPVFEKPTVRLSCSKLSYLTDWSARITATKYNALPQRKRSNAGTSAL